jgi:hypothetical protein
VTSDRRGLRRVDCFFGRDRTEVSKENKETGVAFLEERGDGAASTTAGLVASVENSGWPVGYAADMRLRRQAAGLRDKITSARAGQIKFAKSREIYFSLAERFVVTVAREFFARTD